MFNILRSLAVFSIVAVVGAEAEHHTIRFNNRCKSGTPTLVQDGKILSTGDSDFNIDGPLIAAIVYLQDGSCGSNGEKCTLIETTLKNPTSPGTGSGADISLIPPHAFSVKAGFEYFNGCKGSVTCDNANCVGAAHRPDDNTLQTFCLVNDANLAITFC